MTQICESCLKNNAKLECGICSLNLCKNCSEFVPVGAFEFMQEIPEKLNKSCYCKQCFESNVEPELQQYQQDMDAAHNFIVYFKGQGKETRLFKRTNRPLSVALCADKEECVLRLAYQAHKAGFNALVDVDFKSEKSRTHAYQTIVWSGQAYPVNLDPIRYAPEEG